MGCPEDGNPGLVQSEYFTSIGLVLYIVREIVVAKGGTVKVASTAQECTTFTVCIPRFRPVEGDNRGQTANEVVVRGRWYITQHRRHPLSTQN